MSEMKFSASPKQKMEIVMSCSCGVTPRIFVDAYDTKYVERLQAENVRLKESLKKLLNEAAGLIYTHEFALSMDDGNSNIQVLSMRINEARKALEEK